MDAAQNPREEEEQRLLVRLAELMIEEQVEQGVFLGTPHYSIIERAAMKLGRDLSRQAQERGAREVAAHSAAEVACPSCQCADLFATALALDGGRILTRAVAGRGVHDEQWKETKVGCLMTMSSCPSDTDPHPDLPGCFASKKYVERLVRELHAVRSGSHESRENTGDPAEIAEILEQIAEPEELLDQNKRQPGWPRRCKAQY